MQSVLVALSKKVSQRQANVTQQLLFKGDDSHLSVCEEHGLYSILATVRRFQSRFSEMGVLTKVLLVVLLISFMVFVIFFGRLPALRYENYTYGVERGLIWKGILLLELYIVCFGFISPQDYLH